MDWINIHVSILDSPEFLGSEPVDRATWMCLMRFCVGQENGGRIEDCIGWSDRKWQQLCRITREEALRECPLWRWSKEGIDVLAYPSEKQKEIEAKRKAGKSTVAKRWRAKEHGGISADNSANSSAKNNNQNSSAINSADTEGEVEGERKGKEMNTSYSSPKETSETTKKNRSKRSERISDEEFYAQIRNSEAFSMLNIDHELALMRDWIADKPNRQMTHLFIKNWLRRSAIDAIARGCKPKEKIAYAESNLPEANMGTAAYLEMEIKAMLAHEAVHGECEEARGAALDMLVDRAKRKEAGLLE